MPLVKHDYPVLKYDTASKAVFSREMGKNVFLQKQCLLF